jgi:hypothetical protein
MDVTPFRYFQTEGHPAQFLTCSCGEYRTAALRPFLINGEPACRNCTSKRTKKAACVLCNQIAPLEWHHIGGRAYPQLVEICINCHACVTYAQTIRATPPSLWSGRLDLLCEYLLYDLRRLQQLVLFIKRLCTWN